MSWCNPREVYRYLTEDNPPPQRLLIGTLVRFTSDAGEESTPSNRSWSRLWMTIDVLAPTRFGLVVVSYFALSTSVRPSKPRTEEHWLSFVNLQQRHPPQQPYVRQAHEMIPHPALWKRSPPSQQKGR